MNELNLKGTFQHYIKRYCIIEYIVVFFFLENYKNLIVETMLLRQGAAVPKSWQVPPVITDGEREYTHLKIYYNRRKTDNYS